MVKVKATVGMYQATRYCDSHSEGEIITVEEYGELLKNRAEEIRLDEREFSDYLSDNYSTDEVFAMTEEDKQNVREDFESRCEDFALNSIDDGWKYLEIRTEVVISDRDFADITVKKAKAKCPCPCNQ